jgi:hypothetical protein
MAFWNEGSIDPKRKFRFDMLFGSANIYLPSWIVKKVDKPGFTVAEAKHNFLSHTFYFPGKVEWKEINVSLVDPRGRGAIAAGADGLPDLSENLYKLLLYSGYQLPTQLQQSIQGAGGGNVRLPSKYRSSTPFTEMTIRQLNDDGKPLESWVLRNAWIKDVNFGSLEYGADDLLEIQLKFRYDWAELRIDGGDQSIGNGSSSDMEYNKTPGGSS